HESRQSLRWQWGDRRRGLDGPLRHAGFRLCAAWTFDRRDEGRADPREFGMGWRACRTPRTASAAHRETGGLSYVAAIIAVLNRRIAGSEIRRPSCLSLPACRKSRACQELLR